MSLDALRMFVWFYVKNLLLSLDQLLNVLLGGDPDETLSRRAGRARDRGEGWGCWLCKYLDKIDPRHCDKTLAAVKREEGQNSTFRIFSRWRAEQPKA